MLYATIHIEWVEWAKQTLISWVVWENIQCVGWSSNTLLMKSTPLRELNLNCNYTFNS